MLRRAATVAVTLGAFTAGSLSSMAQEYVEPDGLLVNGFAGVSGSVDLGDPGYCGPVYSVPSMMGSHEGPFASTTRVTSFVPTPIYATYTGATAAFANINQPLVFSFQSLNPNPLLPDLAGLASVPPGFDDSGDGQIGTFEGLPEDFGVTQAVQANAPFPGTVAYVQGQGVFVSPLPLLFQAQSIGSDPTALLPEANGSVAAAEADPNFNGYQLQFIYQFMRDPVTLVIPHPSSTSLTGRTKISQNGSVMPRTRAFLDYGLTSTDDLAGGFTFHRFTPGIERAFFGGMASIEARMPIALTADSAISADTPFSEGNAEYGNASLAVKGLMIRTPRFGFSGGLQLAFPTASDTSVTLADGTRVLEVENESVHVLPFLGAVYDSGTLLFSQMFAQIDIDPNGNSVRANPSLTPGGPLITAPDLFDTDRFYLDWATGLWLYRAPEGPRGPLDLVALAPTIELHYTQSFDRPEVVRVGSLQIGDVTDSVERLDVVIGGSAILQGGTLTAGFGAPLTGDKTHDWEFRLLLNHALR